MATNKGDYFSRYSPRILDNQISTARSVANMVYQQGSAIGGTVRVKNMKNVIDDLVFLRNQVFFWVVLDELSLADEVGE